MSSLASNLVSGSLDLSGRPAILIGAQMAYSMRLEVATAFRCFPNDSCAKCWSRRRGKDTKIPPNDSRSGASLTRGWIRSIRNSSSWTGAGADPVQGWMTRMRFTV